MALSRWWDLAIAGCVLVVAVIVWSSDPEPAQIVDVVVSCLVLVVGWIAAGRRAYEGDARAAVFTIVLIAVSGALVSAYPVLAIFQCVAYPAVWMLSLNTRRAVIAAWDGVGVRDEEHSSGRRASLDAGNDVAQVHPRLVVTCTL